jgi:hypothetical protein
MKFLRALLLPAAILVASVASAQSTTGTVAGRITDKNGNPLSGATVQVKSTTTGLTRGAMSNLDGRFTVAGIEPGMDYTVTARRIGFAPDVRTNQSVALGTTTKMDFVLSETATQLAGVQIVAATDPVISPNKTGVGTTITDSTLHRLPSLNRTFTDFVALTPQISNSGPGLSGGGANNRYNNIQIDGSSEKDLFGLGSTGQPGGQAGGKSIGIEAVKQYQVLLSPYDVRLGNFSGALINAVTKSGANKFFGSAYYYLRDSALTRKSPSLGPFRQSQYGVTLGGPIIKDKALFFINLEPQDQSNPAFGPYVGSTGIPGPVASAADIARVNSIVGPLGYASVNGDARTNTNPLKNYFLRLDFQGLPFNSILTIRDNYAHAEQDVFSRSGSGTTFLLSDNGYTFKSDKSAYVAQLKSSFDNGAYNEVFVGLTHIRDGRVTFVDPKTPQILVRGTGTVSMQLGAERSSQANQLDQDVWEFTENYSFPLASKHRVTVGTQNQWYKVRNLFGQQRYGDWTFNSLDSLQNGIAQQYRIGVPSQAGTDGAVRFHQRTHAFYAQDEWAPTSRLSLTAGIRADASFFPDSIPLNRSVLDTLKKNTQDVPSGNWQISPRIGFNWDITGDGRNQLRGGVGMFTGQPAFVWMSNLYQNSGLTGMSQLTCNGTSATGNNRPPVFNATNVATPPTSCALGSAAPPGTVALSASAAGAVDVSTKDLKFPQSLRYTLGYDREIMGDYVVTLEGLYTRGMNQLFYRNLALKGPQGVDRNGRVMYGPAPTQPVRINGTYNATTAVSTTTGGAYSKNQVFDIGNSSRDYSYQLTAGLTRRYVNNLEASVFYTYSVVRDVQSLTSSTSISQYQFGKSYGQVAQHEHDLGSSIFEQPHRFVFSSTYTFPQTGTDISLQYTGESGNRYHFVYGGSSSGDLNGDGLQNDIVYLPKNVRDENEVIFLPITGAAPATVAQQQDAFEAFLNSDECIKKQIGTIMKRNSCGAPFRHNWNLSVRQRLGSLFGSIGGLRNTRLKDVQIQWDVFNLANLINEDWGRLRNTGGFNTVNLLLYQSKENGSMIVSDAQGADGKGARPRFQFPLTTSLYSLETVSSAYRMQLGVRYSF